MNGYFFVKMLGDKLFYVLTNYVDKSVYTANN